MAHMQQSLFCLPLWCASPARRERAPSTKHHHMDRQAPMDVRTISWLSPRTPHGDAHPGDKAIVCQTRRRPRRGENGAARRHWRSAKSSRGCKCGPKTQDPVPEMQQLRLRVGHRILFHPIVKCLDVACPGALEHWSTGALDCVRSCLGHGLDNRGRSFRLFVCLGHDPCPSRPRPILLPVTSPWAMGGNESWERCVTRTGKQLIDVNGIIIGS